MRLSYLQDVTQMVVAKTLQQEVLDSTTTAFNRFQADLADMLTRLAAPDAALCARLDYLFGSHDAPTLHSVTAIVRRMSDVIQRPISLSFTWAKPRTSDPTNYAYVYPSADPMQVGNLFIYLDNRYKIVQESGLDNRYLTMVHEFSHLAARTDDHKYAEASFWQPVRAMGNSIATGTPPYTTALAVNNADSYGFLMAATYRRVGACTIP